MIAFALEYLQQCVYLGGVAAAVGACMYPRYAAACVIAFMAGGGVAYGLKLCHF